MDGIGVCSATFALLESGCDTEYHVIRISKRNSVHDEF